jgi:hypothetical protein
MSAFIPNSILSAVRAMSDPIASCPMPMRATTVRFDESLWAMLEDEARTQGVSAAQFVRDATILRVAALAAQRGDEDTKLAVEAVAQGALRARAASGGAWRDDGGLPVPREVFDPARLQALRDSGLLELDADPEFDRLARLSARVLDTPVALVTLVDRDRQVFLGCFGLPEPWATTRETPLTHSVCPQALAAEKPLIVPDVRDHPVLRLDPELEQHGVRAYAGTRLCDEAGHAIGTLCVADQQPREWSEEMRATLVDLATSVMTEMRLRRR